MLVLIYIMFFVFAIFGIFGIVFAVCVLKTVTNKSTYIVLSIVNILLAGICTIAIIELKPKYAPENNITTNNFSIQKNWTINTMETRETSPNKLVVYIEDEQVGIIPLNKVEICDTDEVTYNTVTQYISKLKISEQTAIELGIMSERIEVNND